MKRYNRHIALLILTLIGSVRPVSAQQQTQPIDLETVLQLGGANNLTIQEYRQRQELALADLAKAREWWLPDVYAGLNIHQLWGNAMNSDGAIFTGVNRNNLWAGLGLNANWNFGEGIFKAKAEQLRAQAAAYRTQAERNQALLRIIEAYYDLLAAQLYYKAYGQLAAQSDTIAEQIAIQVEAGMRYESELLLAQSSSGHLKVETLNARKEYNNASARLVRLLNLNPTIRLVGTDTVLAPLQLVAEGSPTTPFDTVYDKRPEIRGLELSLRSLQTERKTTTTGLLLPQLTFGAYTSGFGDVFAPVNVREPNGAGFAPTSELNAALLWRIPLGRLFYGGTLKQYNARIALQETELAQTRAQVNEEVLRARQEMATAREQMTIAKEGSRLAQEALSQSIQRQQLGTVRPFEILQAQEVFIRSRIDHLRAVSDFNKAQYGYHVALGNDL